MKPLPLTLVAALALVASARSQEEEAPAPNVPLATPLVLPTAARILGDIPDGTPPPPQAPRPVFVVPARDVLATSTRQQGGRTITFQKIKPIALPPPPVPVEPMVGVADQQFSDRLADSNDVHPKYELLFLGATVYRFKDSAPRTLVHWWPMGGGETIAFWSTADFALIAGGIQSFVDTAGDTHSLMMSWGNVALDRITDLQGTKGAESGVPDMPAFPADKTTFEVVGGEPAPEDLVIIQSLHDIYAAEHQRLQTAYEGRERARLQREADLKAHPPQPQNITLNYWRIEKPAAAQGGAK